MAQFEVKFSEQDLVQIIGEYVRKTFNLSIRESTTVAWLGKSPMGAVVKSSPPTEPYKSEFEE